MCFLFRFEFELSKYSFCRHVDANKARYIDVLREAVEIKSVSGWPDHRAEVSRMSKWTAEKLKKLGAQIELAELGNQTLHSGAVVPLPEVVLGTLGNVSTLTAHSTDFFSPLSSTKNAFLTVSKRHSQVWFMARVSTLERRLSKHFGWSNRNLEFLLVVIYIFVEIKKIEDKDKRLSLAAVKVI